jgi:aryl-alcohol dehydrogenase-like predicted oxidoreductase
MRFRGSNQETKFKKNLVSESGGKDMLTRKLGKSGIEVSAMGMGCWAIGGPFWRMLDDETRLPMGWGQVDDAESIRAVHQGIDLGVSLFDTANNYGAGHSERLLGQALKGRRDQVVVATKFGSVFDEQTKTHFYQRDDPIVRPEFVREACEASLKRLNTDYIDLYQFHWSDYDVELAVDLLPVLEDLVAEGKIRWYGWSTDHLDRARVFAQGEHCTAIQTTLNVFMDAPEMLELVEEFDLACLNKHPLASGSLTGKFHAGYEFPQDDLRHGIDWTSERGQRRLALVDALRELLASDGRTMVQGALAWIWARSERTLPIPGFKTVKQVRENAGAMEFGPLSAEQMQQVDEILKAA